MDQGTRLIKLLWGFSKKWSWKKHISMEPAWHISKAHVTGAGSDRGVLIAGIVLQVEEIESAALVFLMFSLNF